MDGCQARANFAGDLARAIKPSHDRDESENNQVPEHKSGPPQLSHERKSANATSETGDDG
jgi:hypothetical protein